MAERALSTFSGNTVLFVGEGRGGANASDSFFDKLQAEWHVERVLDVHPFPGGFERLFCLKRKQAKEASHTSLRPEQAALLGNY